MSGGVFAASWAGGYLCHLGENRGTAGREDRGCGDHRTHHRGRRGSRSVCGLRTDIRSLLSRAISHSPFGRKVLVSAVAQGMFSPGSNATTRLHHATRRGPMPLAARAQQSPSLPKSRRYRRADRRPRSREKRIGRVVPSQESREGVHYFQYQHLVP